MNFTPTGLPELSSKERTVYSCVIILWVLAVLVTSLFAGICVALVSGMLIAYYHSSGGDWVLLVSSCAFACSCIAWLISDHRSNFMQRSGLAAVDYLRSKTK